MTNNPSRHLSLIAAWALAFGCALGWDAFVIPWTSFLPDAGPAGTLIGLVAGTLVMATVAWNFHFMMNRHPGPGGVYDYATRAFGADHGFLCGWFLSLAYIAIVWMDATVLSFIVKFFSRGQGTGAFGFGFRYAIEGYTVRIEHIVLSVVAIAVVAAICCRRRLAGIVQTVLSVVFVAGILVFAGAAVFRHGMAAPAGPAFAPDGVPRIVQVLGVVGLMPWLFIGFESVSNLSGEFRFPLRKSFGVMLSAIAFVAVAYALLTLIPVLVPGFAPGGGFADWREAVGSLKSGDARASDMAFSTACRTLGLWWGSQLGAATFFAAVFTNLVGNTVAASRLLSAMAADGALPSWLARKNGDGSPRNAVLTIAILSVPVFVLGEAVVQIIVDVAVVGAVLAYAYTSAATYRAARSEGDRIARTTGFAGIALSVLILLLFLLPFFSPDAGTMATESYLVLIVLCIVGVCGFLSALRRDHRRHFGHSPVVWLSLVAVVILLSFLWVRQMTSGTMEKAFDEIITHHDDSFRAEHHADGDVRHVSRDWIKTLRGTERFVDRAVLRNNAVQTGTTFLMLVLLVYLFAIFRRRERELEREKERSKSLFFSSVSHDIRTPLNAVIGFSEMLRSGTMTEAERKRAIDSILMSGRTLLGLVNDILDLSKLESGKMELVPEPTDCPRLLRAVMDAFRVSGNRPGVELRCRFGEMPPLMVDPQRLRQIAFNLVGNAVKFTEKGHVELRAFYDRKEESDAGTLRLEVEDTGCGISEEDLKRIGTDYVQFGPKSSKRTGTGLGLAICRQLTASVGGGFAVESALGRGSTFTITLPAIRPAPNGAAVGGDEAEALPAPVPAAPDGKTRRLLIVDDVALNLQVLQALLRRTGAFETVLASDGAEALKALETPGGKPFDAVLTDLWMPGMDGEALLRAIRANPALAGLPVVALTADVEYRAKYAEIGFDGVLLKPVTLGTISQVLTEVLSPKG